MGESGTGFQTMQALLIPLSSGVSMETAGIAGPNKGPLFQKVGSNMFETIFCKCANLYFIFKAILIKTGKLEITQKY